jgi:hypothetical protein
MGCMDCSAAAADTVTHGCCAVGLGHKPRGATLAGTQTATWCVHPMWLAHVAMQPLAALRMQHTCHQYYYSYCPVGGGPATGRLSSHSGGASSPPASLPACSCINHGAADYTVTVTSGWMPAALEPWPCTPALGPQGSANHSAAQDSPSLLVVHAVLGCCNLGGQHHSTANPIRLPRMQTTGSQLDTAAPTSI